MIRAALFGIREVYGGGSREIGHGTGRFAL